MQFKEAAAFTERRDDVLLATALILGPKVCHVGPKSSVCVTLPLQGSRRISLMSQEVDLWLEKQLVAEYDLVTNREQRKQALRGLIDFYDLVPSLS